MDIRDAFRVALETGDLEAVRGLWAQAMPNMPQPKTHFALEAGMHLARTQLETASLKARTYSHAWLVERGLPSGLPDQLRPKAQRVHPVIVSAVGISVNANSPEMRPVAVMVQKAMSDAVEEAYAEGKTDPLFIRQRMKEARGGVIDRLFG